MQTQLVELYLLVCQLYDTEAVLKYQSMSNFKAEFTEQEIVTIYLFGHLQKKFTVREIYDYIKGHWHAWFPLLPSYQAFNNRLNQMEVGFELLIDALLQKAQMEVSNFDDRLVDSLPVMLAKGNRSSTAKVAKERADKTYCASKGVWYYGVKLHIESARRIGELPMPERIFLTEASCHDLPALEQMNLQIEGSVLFADKAYACSETKSDFENKGMALVTPEKKKKNQKLEQNDSLWSKFVSSTRQPIESLFNWIIEKTGIQNASKVRSTNGLMIHCYGKLAVACLILVLYP